jgi:hypothetical protein
MINKEEKVPMHQERHDARGADSMRLEERDGKQHLLSDNSYLHQTQD